jgi:sugar/nucleoside kinase (ribokinase family)
MKLSFNDEQVRASIVKKIRASMVEVDVVTMPDFFLDHSAICTQGVHHLTDRVVTVASKGGGEIPDIPQRLDVGGNAAICTMALSRLGATVHPVIRTNRLGLMLLEYFLKDFRVDLSHVNTSGSLVPTVILELGRGANVVNVMVGDSAAISELSFDEFRPDDLRLLSNADWVCVFNWLYNRKGTELAEGVFRYCRNTRASTFFDPADPWPRRSELPELARRVIRSDLLDFLGVNENEALLIAKVFNKKIGLHGRHLSSTLRAARIITDATNIKVFVHTATHSVSVLHDESTIVPTFKVPVLRGTGAGDSWNAGIMMAESLGLREEEKLLFANAVAARYISRQDREFATQTDIAEFLQDENIKLNRFVT